MTSSDRSSLNVPPLADTAAEMRPLTVSRSCGDKALSESLKCVLGKFCKFGSLEDSLPVSVPQLQKVV